MRHSSRIAWMLGVVILAHATGATAVEIRTVVVEPECFSGNSPGGCYLIGFNTSGPEAAFGTPPDRQLDFRFVIADGQLIRMIGGIGYDLTFTVTPPEVTVNLDGITVQFRSGKVFTTGPLGPFPEGFQVGGGCTTGFPEGEGVRAACDESAWPFLEDELLQQVLVSFSLDAADPTQPQLAIGRLIIYAGIEGAVLLVPQPPALWLLAVALVGMIVVSYRRRAGRPVS